MRNLKFFATGAVAVLSAALLVSLAFGRASPPRLRDAKSFNAIADRNARSIALFQEAGKVLQSPRCLNCHPAGDHPSQGVDMHPHIPPVVRGDGDMGAAAMQCGTCHLEANTPIKAASIHSVPGNPRWRLAPIEQAWQGKSLGEICRQIKDPARNGGKTLAQLHEHMARDQLVGWGWTPGDGREPVPGTQAQFGEIIRAWIGAGAACPS
jgi:hypothetical protein